MKQKQGSNNLSKLNPIITEEQKHLVRKRISSTTKHELLEWRKAIKKLKF